MESTIGGTRRHITDVASGQRSLGLDVHIVVATEREPRFLGDLERLEREGVGVERLPMVRSISPGLDLAHGRRLASLLRTLQPDIVHTHSSKAGVLGRLASVATGIGSRVHTPHTFAFLFEAMFGALKRRLFREIEAGLAGHTQALVAVSHSEARTFIESGVVSRERVRIVENGIDAGPWAVAEPIDRAALGLREGAPLALVVGLLNKAKGQDLAIEMLTRPGLEHLQLAIAGPGEDQVALEQQARALGVAERVRLLGYRDDVPALMRAADFLLLSSRWEGMPYVVLEALAASRPVVATPVDGALDILADGRSGVMAESIDVDALAAATRELLAFGPDERLAMGERGAERVRAEYTVERMVKRLVDVYGAIL
jgi:glycosyltransferase involved in cell wall biosynthesis